MQSTGKTLIDWIDLYNKKSGEQFCLLPNATMWADHKHGIVTWEVKEGQFWIRHCSCDFRYWLPILNEFVKSLGFTYALTTTRRNPQAYTRLTGAKHIGEMNDRHLFMWEVL